MDVTSWMLHFLHKRLKYVKTLSKGVKKIQNSYTVSWSAYFCRKQAQVIKAETSFELTIPVGTTAIRWHRTNGQTWAELK